MNFSLNKQSIAQSFSKAAKSYDNAAQFQRDVGDRLLTYMPKDCASVVVDLGCGTGSQIHYIQKLGFTNTTGTDIVNALEYDVKNFIIDDALDSKLDQRYDIVFDRGLLHNIYHLKNKLLFYDHCRRYAQ